ncbi:hypothetical protein [Paenibacillus sp. FSL K6-1318]|uniref:alpha/beta hydrolase family protein n=1 Tax=Paenibacillus sp. FSL K6-1318 TaxID=2975291 RepID=UPI0030ECB43F
MFGNLKALPKPMGTYVVGLTEMSFTDDTRVGLFEFATEEPRHVPVMIFYPADHHYGKPQSPYTSKEEAEHFSKSSRGLISSKVQHLKTHSYRDIPLSAECESYPVIFFNHGYSSQMSQNTVLCSDLASSGYIVVSIGHPYEASILKYPDGHIVKSHTSLINEFKQTMSPEIQKKFKDMKKREYTDEEILPAVTDFFEYFKSTKVWSHVHIWADDNRFIADKLEQLNDGILPSPFQGKLNFQAGIGVTGHSYGGCTASQVCLDDTRFSCGINIDAPTYGEFWNKDLRKPFMVIGSKTVEYLARTTFLLNSEDSYLITIDQTEHMDFTDYIYYARQFKYLRLLGKRKMDLLRDVLSHYHISFFDQYLRDDRSADLLQFRWDGVHTRSRIT